MITLPQDLRYESEYPSSDSACLTAGRLFWEAGMVEQVLYLEAEAISIQGTGIGCFFDDAFHQTLGITDTRFQSLYHFTLGGALNDARLRTIPPYQHIQR